MSRKANFFWRGDKFSYLHRLCVKSHVEVGHQCVMWLSGPRPNSPYWIDDLDIEIANADDVVNVTQFLEDGGNLKTASDLWSFVFLYERGGLYCDTDALAVKPFPDDEWIACSCDPANTKAEKLSIGVMAAPKGCPVFLSCANKIKKKWGNVTVFGDEYEKHFGHHNSTHADTLFYPYKWQLWRTLFEDVEIPDVYSIHLYHSPIERNGMVKDKAEYDNNTLLGRLIQKFDN